MLQPRAAFTDFQKYRPLKKLKLKKSNILVYVMSYDKNSRLGSDFSKIIQKFSYFVPKQA